MRVKYTHAGIRGSSRASGMNSPPVYHGQCRNKRGYLKETIILGKNATNSLFEKGHIINNYMMTPFVLLSYLSCTSSTSNLGEYDRYLFQSRIEIAAARVHV